jgi:hypothetical protein
MGEVEERRGGRGRTTTNTRAVVGNPTKPFYLEPNLCYRANGKQPSSGPSCPDRYCSGGLSRTSSLPQMLKFLDEMLLELFLYFHHWMEAQIILHQYAYSLEAGLMNP